jgi:hypothetical protein
MDTSGVALYRRASVKLLPASRSGGRAVSRIPITPERAAALRQAAPYVATFVIVLGLLLVAFLQGPKDEQTRTAGTTGTPASAGSTPTTPETGPYPPTGEPPPNLPAKPTGVPSTGSTDGTAAAPGPGGGQTATAAGRPGPRLIAWIRDLGLTGGGGSYEEAWLAELSWGECAELLHSVESTPLNEVDRTARDLFRAAAQSCLAAFHGKSSLWAAAGSGIEELSGRSAGFNCIDRSVYDLTRSLVRIHRDNPQAVLRRGRADEADGPDCPRLRKVAPDSGAPEGGYPVTITGEHLPNPAVIHFGDTTMTVPTEDGRTAVVTVPPVGQYPGVAVWVEGWPYEYTQTPTFDYVQTTSEIPEDSEQSNGS